MSNIKTLTEEEIILDTAMTKDEWREVFVIIRQKDMAHDRSIMGTVPPPPNKFKCEAILEVLAKRKKDGSK